MAILQNTDAACHNPYSSDNAICWSSQNINKNFLKNILTNIQKKYNINASQIKLEITETEPGFKGDTATGATKPAVVETGATVYVPLFVELGDKIKIDTRSGEYLSRV